MSGYELNAALALAILIVCVAFVLEVRGFFTELDNPRPDGDDGGR